MYVGPFTTNIHQLLHPYIGHNDNSYYEYELCYQNSMLISILYTNVVCISYVTNYLIIIITILLLFSDRHPALTWTLILPVHSSTR